MGEADRLGRHERTVLAETVTHHHVRHHAVGCQEALQGDVRRQYRRLRYCRLPESVVGGLFLQWTFGIDKQVVGQGTAQQRLHDLVRLAEGLGHDRLIGGQLPQHVQVLRPLPGEEHRDLGRPARSEEDAAAPQGLPGLRFARLKGRKRSASLLDQLGSIAVVDGQPDRGPQVGFRRRLDFGDFPCLGRGQHLPQSGCHISGRITAQNQGPSKRLFLAPQVSRRAQLPRDGDRSHFPLESLSRYVFLQHGVEVRSTKAEGTHARPPHLTFAGLPGP